MARFTLPELTTLAERALERAGAQAAMATATARALVAADAQGLASHGVSRVPQYATHLANGRADGSARPSIVRERGGAALVDARCGLAFPACALAVDEAIRRAREFGVAFVAVTNSHHFGVAAHHLEPVAAAGMFGMAFGNSPSAMPAAGGRRPLFGTNPIAAAFPRRDGASGQRRPVAVGGRARQADGRRQGRPRDSRRLGARRRRQPHDRSEGRARRIDAADGRDEGRDAGADRRGHGHRADRRGDRLRGELVLRRRRQPAAAGAGVPRRRSRGARRPRGLPRPGRDAGATRCWRTRACGCRGRGAGRWRRRRRAKASPSRTRWPRSCARWRVPAPERASREPRSRSRERGNSSHAATRARAARPAHNRSFSPRAAARDERTDRAMKDTTTRKTEAPAAGAKPAKPRAPRAAAAKKTRTGDVGPTGSPAAIERHAVQESVAAAEEAQANALTDILAGRSPVDAAELMRGLLKDQQARARRLPADPDEELSSDWRTGGYPYKNLLSRKSYERQKYRLQVELLKLQAWVKETRPAGRHPVRGARRRRQGRRDQALHGAPQSARRARRGAREADRSASAASGTSSATSSICRRRARSCCSTGPGTTAPASSA